MFLRGYTGLILTDPPVFRCCGKGLREGWARSHYHARIYAVSDFKKDLKIYETEHGKATDGRAITLDCEMGVNKLGEQELIWA